MLACKGSKNFQYLAFYWVFLSKTNANIVTHRQNCTIHGLLSYQVTLTTYHEIGRPVQDHFEKDLDQDPF